MQKNVKGFIGLFAGIAAFIVIIIATIPFTPINGTSLNFYGSINSTLALIGAALGIIAIIFGALSAKDKDKKGPRKAGIIVGIFAVIIGLIFTGVASLLASITDYANNVPGNALSQMDEANRKEIDNLLDQMRTKYPEK